MKNPRTFLVDKSAGSVVDSPACGRATSRLWSATGAPFTTARLRIHSSQTPIPNTKPILTDGRGRWIRPPAGGPPRGSDMPPACHSLPLGFESTFTNTHTKQKNLSFWTGFLLGGGRWIRTTEGIASRFTVCPLWPLGNSPIFDSSLERWSWWTDSNPRPADYKSAALPAELHQRNRSARL